MSKLSLVVFDLAIGMPCDSFYLGENKTVRDFRYHFSDSAAKTIETNYGAWYRIRWQEVKLFLQRTEFTYTDAQHEEALKYLQALENGTFKTPKRFAFLIE